MHRETLWLPGHLGSTELCQTFYQWIKMNGYIAIIAKRGTSWFLSRSSAVLQVLWKTKSGNEAGCAKAGKDFHMQARDAERGETGWKRCGAGFI